MCRKNDGFIWKFILLHFYYSYIKFILLKYYSVSENLLFSQVHCSKRCMSIACHFFKIHFQNRPVIFWDIRCLPHVNTVCRRHICFVFSSMLCMFVVRITLCTYSLSHGTEYIMTGKWGAKTMAEFENILKQDLASEEMSLQQNFNVACLHGYD